MCVQEVCTVSSIALLFNLIGHNMVFIAFRMCIRNSVYKYMLTLIQVYIREHTFNFINYKTITNSYSWEYWNGRFLYIQQMKWFGIYMVVWKPDWKKPVHGPKCLVFEWSAKSPDFAIWIPDTHAVWYSDESGIQVFSIQMVMNFLLVKELPIVECNDEVDTHVEACPSPHVLLTWNKKQQDFLREHS